MSKEVSQEEAKDLFIDAINSYVAYWKNQDISKGESLDGLAFGILNIIDGTSSAFPCSIDLVLRPHPDDKQYNIENGDDYIVDGMCINNRLMLHEDLHK